MFLEALTKSIRRILLGISVILFVLTPYTVQPQEKQKYFDVLFVNGKIIDGTGNPGFYGDVGIKEGRIVALRRFLDRARATRVIDIGGKILAPGFIDIHDHAYDRIVDEKVWQGEDEKRYFAPNFVSQGVTTVVSNQCGSSPISIRKQREVLTAEGIGPNAVLMIGHNAIRHFVMKNDHERPATDEEVQKMCRLVSQAMEDGAAGMSTGLEYVPSIWSRIDEIIALVKEIVPYGGVYQVHERASGLSPMWYLPSQHETGPPNMLTNIEELIEVGEKTGVTVIATHIKSRGVNFWGGSKAIIQLINRARGQGVDIWADCYPYNSSGSDGNVVLIPRWALGNNYQQELENTLNDPEKARNLNADMKHAINWRGGTDKIIVMDYPDESYIGKSIAQLAREHSLSDIEMIIKLQLEGDPKRPGGARLRGFSMSEMDIEAFYSQPWTATCSDAAIALPTDGPVHPRYYGTFPRKIKHYALERQVIAVEDAIRSSTSLPAQIFGILDRGIIREGFHADIVVFDPHTIRDTATFFEPHQYAEGIDFVLVNGDFVVDERTLTWRKPGIVITKEEK